MATMRIIAGEFGGRTLKTTSAPGYRPATSKVRQAVFSMLESRGVYWPETRVLDLFAGSGALTFEALSRGAEEGWFVEMNPKAAALIGENAERLGIASQRYRVLADDMRNVVGKRAAEPFDLVFIDPPYGFNFLSPALSAVLRNGWLAEGGFVCAEVEAKLPLPPETEHPDLECIANRAYGQTRILLWTGTESA